MWLDRNNTSVEIRAEHMRQIDLIANEPSVRGVKLALYGSIAVTRELDGYSMLRSPSHFVWYRNTWSGGVEQKWDAGILPFIRSIKGVTKSTCPSRTPERAQADLFLLRKYVR